jgi:hypothetical protein
MQEEVKQKRSRKPVEAIEVHPHDEIRDLVVFMKNQGVEKFSFKDLSVEFRPHGEVDTRPTFIDDKEQQLHELKQAISEVAKDDDLNIAWST